MNWKKGDILVVAIVLLVALTMLAIRALPTAVGSRVLRIELDSETIQEVPLSEDMQENIKVAIENGEAVVEIENGRVRMLPMSKDLCPQGVCSHVGWVERPGDTIVCLPNRLVLTIIGNDTEEVLDGKTQ